MSGSAFDSAGVLKVNRHERHVDDITGRPLSPELCWKARRLSSSTSATRMSRPSGRSARR